MNGGMFDLCIRTQRAPTLRRGDVVIPDNLPSHKSPAAARTLHAIGAWFLFLPRYRPGLNPVEMAFAKLKTLLRKAAARSFDPLWHAVGHVCDLLSDEECCNLFKAAGYRSDETRHASKAHWPILPRSGWRCRVISALQGWGGMKAPSVLPRCLTTTVVPTSAIGKAAAEGPVARLKGKRPRCHRAPEPSRSRRH